MRAIKQDERVISGGHVGTTVSTVSALSVMTVIKTCASQSARCRDLPAHLFYHIPISRATKIETKVGPGREMGPALFLLSSSFMARVRQQRQQQQKRGGIGRPEGHHRNSRWLPQREGPVRIGNRGKQSFPISIRTPSAIPIHAVQCTVYLDGRAIEMY